MESYDRVQHQALHTSNTRPDVDVYYDDYEAMDGRTVGIPSGLYLGEELNDLMRFFRLINVMKNVVIVSDQEPFSNFTDVCHWSIPVSLAAFDGFPFLLSIFQS